MVSLKSGARCKILLLSAAYPEKEAPYRAIFIQRMARALAEDHRVVVVCPRVHRKTSLREDKEGVKVRRFPYLSGDRGLKGYSKTPWFRSITFFLSALWTGLIQSRRADFLFVHWLLPMGPLGGLLALWRKIPLVLYIHGSDLWIYSKKNFLFRRLSEWTLRKAKVIFVTSSAMKTELEKQFGVSSSVVLPCGVGEEFEKIRGRREKNLSWSPPFRILFVGNLTELKGARDFLGVAEILLNKRKDLRFCLVGEGPLEFSLREKGRQAIAEGHLVLTGPLAPFEVAGLLSQSHLFVLPSYTEGCPVAALEALAAGVPVIGTTISAFREILEEGKNGEMVPPGEVETLARTIEDALEKYRNQSFGPSPAQNWERWKDEFYRELYQKICSGDKKRT